LTLLINMIRSVNQAITDLLEGAQSASIANAGGTETYSRARLPELLDLRRQLYNEYTAGQSRRRVIPDFGG
jgi:hypothetical protein